MNDIEALFERFSKDRFRSRFRLFERERAYLERWGIEKVMRDAEQILRTRVASAHPANDGKQTPWRNHPVFIAQHATATCCRGCIAKWHSIPKGAPLQPEELQRILVVIRTWLDRAVIRDQARARSD